MNSQREPPLRLLGFFGGGATMGLLLSATTSRMMEAIRMFGSAGRCFSDGLFMAAVYHANRR
jgi:hypothetical protein